MIGDSTLVQPASGGPDLAALATFALDPAGRLDSWNQSAERLFGRPATDLLGRHVCDVLLTGPGHRDLVGRALAEVAAGQVWTGQVARDGLAAAAARIGSTLDLTRTADEAVSVAVPAFADGAIIYLAERLLVDEFSGSAAGHTAVVRRVAVRLAGRPDYGPGGPLPIGEVLAFGPGTPHARVMAAVSSRLLEHGEDDITLVLARLSPA